jgi:tRNA-(ms[2]io[6]A)-hydroxylase
MLGLKWETPRRWVDRVEEDLDAVLIDHAHCEKKAAGVGMSMLFAYVTDQTMVRALSEVVREELDHLRQVLDILERRGLTIRSQTQSSYGQRLGALIRKEEPGKVVDRCLVAALIEARSCERFSMLGEHLEDRELAAFYGSLMESEARHHGLYVRLAARYASKDEVNRRLADLAEEEARIISRGDAFIRLHS